MVVDLDPVDRRRWSPPAPRRRGRRTPGSRPRSRGSGRAARSPPARRPGRRRRAARSASRRCTRRTPSAGSICLVIRVSWPSASKIAFISSSASVFTSSTASRMPGPALGEQGLLHADRVHGVAVDQQRAAGEVVTGQPERVRVVPLLGPVVVHQGEASRRTAPPGPAGGPRTASAAYPTTTAIVGQPDLGQVAQRDVQDRGLAVHRHQRLGQACRCTGAAGVRRPRRAPSRSWWGSLRPLALVTRQPVDTSWSRSEDSALQLATPALPGAPGLARSPSAARPAHHPRTLRAPSPRRSWG